MSYELTAAIMDCKHTHMPVTSRSDAKESNSAEDDSLDNENGTNGDKSAKVCTHTKVTARLKLSLNNR